MFVLLGLIIYTGDLTKRVSQTTNRKKKRNRTQGRLLTERVWHAERFTSWKSRRDEQQMLKGRSRISKPRKLPALLGLEGQES